MMEEELAILKHDSNSLVSATIGRVISTLLTSRPRKLQDAISSFTTVPKSGSLASLDEALWCIHKYVKDAAEKQETLDQILVPMIEHSLKFKESKHGGQAMILLNWLFQDKLLFQALAGNLAKIILEKEDRYIALGWCILVRGLIEHEITINQYPNNGIMENYNALLKILCSCIPHLLHILCNGSILQDGFELPTRLSVSAADCILALTEAITKKALTSQVSSSRSNSSSRNVSNQPISLLPSAVNEKKVKLTSRSPEVSNNMEMELLLWNHLDELIILVQRLLAWSRKSRLLHAKGLEQVLKWLQEIKEHYVHLHNEADSKTLKNGILVLYSCWKHYSMLLHLEDHKFSKRNKELLEQYLSGIQFYTDSLAQEPIDKKDSGIETIKFFVNCICLLLGRQEGRQFESTMSEYGLQIARVLLSQLHCVDEDVIDGALFIFKAAIFKMNPSVGSSFHDTRQMDAVWPLLLHLLDERDGTARAAVTLTAEFCSISTSCECLQEVLKRLASGNVIQRRNAVDVISELICISSNSVNVLSQMMWQDIANHLLERLGDENLVGEKASNLLLLIDPSLVLPALVRLVYASDERIQSSARDAVIEVLKSHNQKFEVICMLLDSLSNICQGTTEDVGEGPKSDADRVLRLIPEWSKTVQDWNNLIGPLIDKMFVEPSNAIIVRFLSYISEHLSEVADVVLHRVLFRMKGQKEWDARTCAGDDPVKMQHFLFDRLCPLLIIRMLPLRVFNDLSSSMMYGQFVSVGVVPDLGDVNVLDHECLAAFLLNRAFNKLEFEDVRKLAAELCGRIHPQVLFPIIFSQLEHAADSRDILKIKACLFSTCTSLVVRGRDSLLHPVMLKITEPLETILLWPSLDGDEVSKAQHGCIDCLALMICTELQDSTSYKISPVGKDSCPGDVATGNSVLNYVIYQLTQDKNKFVSSSKSVPIPFRLCMANVLISACQKILDSGKKPFARKTIPQLIQLNEVMTESEVRAACVQVLFSAVYHLKRAVLPHASDLFKLCLKSLTKGSEKEKMASAKLMVSLMTSDDAVVERVAGFLVEARTLLSILSLTDPSPDLRQVCKKLLACMTS